MPDVSGVAIANLEVESLQHKKPTFHGDTIYAETKVLDKKESQSKPDRGVVSVETRGFNQRGEEVCYFRRRVMVPEAGRRRSPVDARTSRPSRSANPLEDPRVGRISRLPCGRISDRGVAMSNVPPPPDVPPPSGAGQLDVGDAVGYGWKKFQRVRRPADPDRLDHRAS